MTGATVIICALLSGLAIALLDMTADHLRIVLVLLVALGFFFGALAPGWALLSGLCVGVVQPMAQVYVTTFHLKLPHPMHGFFYGALAVVPPVVSALVGMWLRKRFDERRQSDQLRRSID